MNRLLWAVLAHGPDQAPCTDLNDGLAVGLGTIAPKFWFGATLKMQEFPQVGSGAYLDFVSGAGTRRATAPNLNPGACG